MERKPSKLEHGLIPIGTVCPFRSECKYAYLEPGTQAACKHKGVEHKVAFSCGAARAFDIFSR